MQAVRLESAWSDRVRYMVVVYTSGRQDTEENILLGIDFTNKDWYKYPCSYSLCTCICLMYNFNLFFFSSKSCSIGMVLPLWSDTKIHLDGDGWVFRHPCDPCCKDREPSCSFTLDVPLTHKINLIHMLIHGALAQWVTICVVCSSGALLWTRLVGLMSSNPYQCRLCGE